MFQGRATLLKFVNYLPWKKLGRIPSKKVFEEKERAVQTSHLTVTGTQKETKRQIRNVEGDTCVPVTVG